MSRRTINSGKAPLVWSTIDEAFESINANFQELYASVGGTAIGFDALTSSLIPNQNGEYDLGFPTKRWKNLYLSSTLSIGGVTITSEGLTIDLPSGTTVAGQLIIDPEKTFFKEVSVDGETSIIADRFSDTINLESGTAIRINTNSSADTIVINNDGVTRITAGTAMTVSDNTGNVTINNNGVTSIVAGLGISRNTASGAVTIANEGIVDIDAGVGISVGARDSETGKVIITNTAPAGNAYRIFAVAGEASLPARSSGDTLTLIEGNGINITTALAAGALTNRVTVENTGVLSVTGSSNIIASAGTGNITLTFNNRTDIIGSIFADDSTMLVDGTNGRIVGPVFSNVTGNLTGNVVGNTSGTHTGSVVGNVSGNLTGNVIGNVDGDLNGSVFADDSSVLVDGTGGKIVGPVQSASVVATSFIQTAVYADLTAIAAAFPIPTKGMIVFDDGTSQFRGYNGSSWVALN